MQGTNLGGTEQASLRLMAGLQRRGHSCAVLSLNPIGSLGPLLAEHRISAQGLVYRGRGGWRSFPSLRGALRHTEADALLMTGHNLLGMLAVGDLYQGRRVLAVHFHHTGTKSAQVWRLIYFFASRRFNAITFPSDFIRQEAEALYPRLKDMVQTVRNPLEIPDIPSAAERAIARRTLGLPKDIPLIGNAGWLIRRKRFYVFLRVAQRVLQSVPQAAFVIAGDGEERPRLEALAAELHLDGRVFWLGWVKDMRHFYQSVDIMLFNSDWDAMGLSPLEALSYGVPLVASVEHGGLQEVLSGPAYGYLISEHNIEALAAKVLEFVENPQYARGTALAGRERVRQTSNADSIAAEVEALFQVAG